MIMFLLKKNKLSNKCQWFDIGRKFYEKIGIITIFKYLEILKLDNFCLKFWDQVLLFTFGSMIWPLLFLLHCDCQPSSELNSLFNLQRYTILSPLCMSRNILFGSFHCSVVVYPVSSEFKFVLSSLGIDLSIAMWTNSLIDTWRRPKGIIVEALW